ncbi:DUF433 domain-containing protein [Dehalococcoidia bacterium]|nr:DUF433 domain-containing protein [Dehalococcoidia bacterium]
MKGTRVPVELILGKLAGGMGFEEVMRFALGTHCGIITSVSKDLAEFRDFLVKVRSSSPSS